MPRLFVRRDREAPAPPRVAATGDHPDVIRRIRAYTAPPPVASVDDAPGQRFARLHEPGLLRTSL